MMASAMVCAAIRQQNEDSWHKIDIKPQKFNCSLRKNNKQRDRKVEEGESVQRSKESMNNHLCLIPFVPVTKGYTVYDIAYTKYTHAKHTPYHKCVRTLW